MYGVFGNGKIEEISQITPTFLVVSRENKGTFRITQNYQVVSSGITIYMKTFLNSDWLRAAVQFFRNAVPKSEIQCKKIQCKK
jgi:hypothetical protein